MARGQVVTNAHSGLDGTVEGRPITFLSQTFICIYVYMYVCVWGSYMIIYVYAHMYICICIYI
jgi:hypothetical protein